MHFRFHVDGERFHKAFGGRFGGRGGRWAAFARAMADEFGADGPEHPRRRRFGADALKIVILHLLQREPRHGYELIKTIEDLSAGLYSPSPGMIYPMLTLLAEQGLISELPGADSKRRYAITADGEAALAAAEADLKQALHRLAEMAGMAGHRRPHADVRDAMADLKSAIRAQLATQDDSSDRAARIAEILATATRAVEALDD